MRRVVVLICLFHCCGGFADDSHAKLDSAHRMRLRLAKGLSLLSNEGILADLGKLDAAELALEESKPLPMPLFKRLRDTLSVDAMGKIPDPGVTVVKVLNEKSLLAIYPKDVKKRERVGKRYVTRTYKQKVLLRGWDTATVSKGAVFSAEGLAYVTEHKEINVAGTEERARVHIIDHVPDQMVREAVAEKLPLWKKLLELAQQAQQKEIEEAAKRNAAILLQGAEDAAVGAMRQSAAYQLKEAKSLLAKRTDAAQYAARKRLERIIEKHPESAEAKEARRLLKSPNE